MGIPGLDLLDASGHWSALDELSQKMLQKVDHWKIHAYLKEPSLLTVLISKVAGLENLISGILVDPYLDPF